MVVETKKEYYVESPTDSNSHHDHVDGTSNSVTPDSNNKNNNNAPLGRPTTPLLDWGQYLKDVETAHNSLLQIADQLKQSFSQLDSLQAEFESKYLTQKKDIESLKAYLKDITDTLQYKEAKEKIESWSRDLKQLSFLMPVSGGIFVELFLGTTDLGFRRRQQRMAFKTVGGYIGRHREMVAYLAYVFFGYIYIAI